jgi:hypothetical protein
VSTVTPTPVIAANRAKASCMLQGTPLRFMRSVEKVARHPVCQLSKGTDDEAR